MSFSDLEDFDKDLLRSAESDHPTAAARAANRAAVMKAAGFAAAGAAGAVGKTTSTTAKAASLAKLAAVPKLLMLAAACVIAAGVVLTAIALQRSGAGSTSPVDRSPSASSPPLASATNDAVRGEDAPVAEIPKAPASARAPSSASPEPNAPGETASASASRRARVTPSPSASATPSVPRPDSLAAETRLLEEARACADRDDLACASAKLSEHRRQFARGTLAEEATLLRIQVARRRGDVEEARGLASELLRTNPNGPYARRARAVLDELARAGSAPAQP